MDFDLTEEIGKNGPENRKIVPKTRKMAPKCGLGPVLGHFPGEAKSHFSLREAKPGGFPFLFSPDCFADPFGNVPCRCFTRPRKTRRTDRENPRKDLGRGVTGRDESQTFRSPEKNIENEGLRAPIFLRDLSEVVRFSECTPLPILSEFEVLHFCVHQALGFF